jgi:hypothetical protein
MDILDCFRLAGQDLISTDELSVIASRAPLGRFLHTVFKNRSIGNELICEGQDDLARPWCNYSLLYPEEDVQVLRDSIAKIPDWIRSIMLIERTACKGNMDLAFWMKGEAQTCTTAASLTTISFCTLQ